MEMIYMLTVRELRDILENVPDHKRIILKVGSGYYEVTYTFDDTVENTGTGHARLYVVILEGRADGK